MLTPEKMDKAFELLHKNAQKQLDVARILLEILEQHEDKIHALTARIKELEDTNAHEGERRYQQNLDELDRQDGEWYRKVNDLG